MDGSPQPFDTEVFPVLETERLILREIVASDAADVFAFRRDPEEQRHNDPPLRSLPEARELIDRLAREYREERAIRWGLTVKGEGAVVGLLGYNYWNVAHFRAGLGYDLKRSLRYPAVCGAEVPAASLTAPEATTARPISGARESLR
ncbi:MAG: GNAT family N-acetyltransferase [Pseudonocardiaceae bacterium]